MLKRLISVFFSRELSKLNNVCENQFQDCTYNPINFGQKEQTSENTSCANNCVSLPNTNDMGASVLKTFLRPIQQNDFVDGVNFLDSKQNHRYRGIYNCASVLKKMPEFMTRLKESLFRVPINHYIPLQDGEPMQQVELPLQQIEQPKERKKHNAIQLPTISLNTSTNQPVENNQFYSRLVQTLIALFSVLICLFVWLLWKNIKIDPFIVLIIINTILFLSFFVFLFN